MSRESEYISRIRAKWREAKGNAMEWRGDAGVSRSRGYHDRAEVCEQWVEYYENQAAHYKSILRDLEN